MTFVSSSIYHKAVRLSLNEGLPSKLLAHHKERNEIIRGDKYLPMALLLEVYELADKHLETGFGVRQGMQLNSEDYGTLGLSWRTCWRAKDVLDRTARYMILVTDHGSARIEESEGFTKIIMTRDAGRRGLEIANEATFVMMAGIISEVTGKELHPVNVCFKHTVIDTKPFTDYFKCPVGFGQDKNALQYKNSAIDIPTIKADKSIHQFLVDRMNEEQKGVHANANHMLSEIHKLIEESLPSGIPSIIQVAEHLNMSARTLKRRLAEKDLTFRDLVQKIQQEVCIYLLRNSAQSVGEIAFQTGFSEQSAFNRAFKRWTGQSPLDYRKNK